MRELIRINFVPFRRHVIRLMQLLATKKNCLKKKKEKKKKGKYLIFEIMISGYALNEEGYLFIASLRRCAASLAIDAVADHLEDGRQEEPWLLGNPKFFRQYSIQITFCFYKKKN